MYCLLTTMHEDMLFYRGECVTHWEIQVFLRFSGELVSFRKLGQPDLYISYSKSLGLSMSTIHPMGSACVGFTPGPPEN